MPKLTNFWSVAKIQLTLNLSHDTYHYNWISVNIVKFPHDDDGDDGRLSRSCSCSGGVVFKCSNVCSFYDMLILTIVLFLHIGTENTVMGLGIHLHPACLPGVDQSK